MVRGDTAKTGSQSFSTLRISTVAGTTELLLTMISRVTSSPWGLPASTSPKSMRDSDSVMWTNLPIADSFISSTGCGLIALTPRPTSQVARATKTEACVGNSDAVMVCDSATPSTPSMGSRRNGGGTVHENGAGTSPVFVMTKVRSLVSAVGQRPMSSPAGQLAWSVDSSARTGTWNPRSGTSLVDPTASSSSLK